MQDALEYVAIGLPVFPVLRKRPLKRPEVGLEHGFYDATADVDVLRLWFENVDSVDGLAMPTGRVTNSVVLDVDREKGGLVSLAELSGRTLETIPDATPAQLTGGGGYQVFFAYPGFEVRSNAGKLGPGLDIRADGGYVVLPRSLHRSGNRYVWLEGRRLGEVSVAPCPDWLLGALEQEAERRMNRAPPAPTWTGDPRDTVYGRAALASACEKIRTAPNGSRERTLNDEAFGIGQLVAGGELSEATAKPALEAACEGLLAAWRGTPHACHEGAAWQTLAAALREGQFKPRVASRGGTS